jgi:serine phosphatase RsbU (regulator of sigma subunit)
VAARARALAQRHAHEAGRDDLVDDVALVVTELVTNAVLHGHGCTAVDVLRHPDGLRVEVRDRSPLPPVFGHASDESLTGRGVRLVAALSVRWGAEAESTGGKVVWAELTGETHPLDVGAEADLLAMWADDFGEPAGPVRYRVDLGEVPTDLLLAAKAHVDNLMREFALVSSGASTGVSADVPGHLRTLLGAVEAFGDARLSIKRQALDAARRGAATTELSLDLPGSAADLAEDYLGALDEIDAYCRAMRLLTLETPPQHRVFRQWYLSELIAQLRAADAGQKVPPPQPFEQRLLSELDRVALAQRALERAARLYSVASALASADSPEAVATAVLNEGAAALGASGGGLLLPADADRLALPGVVGYDEDVVARLRTESRNAELPAASALRTGEPVWLESRAERDRRFPQLVGMEAATISLCAVPLEVEGRRLGALRFSFSEARLFDDDERRFVLALAAQAAQALDRAQLLRARMDVSQRLQRGLLPPRLPDIDGLEVAAIYHPFGDGVEVGGDFYDIWELGNGRWAIAIGDAAGTGPEAAALSALVRHTIRALTMTGADIEGIVRTLNQALLDAAEDGTERFCTAVFGVIDTADGVSLTLASGGHPPVTIRRADGTIETITVGGTILGLFPKIEVGVARLRLDPDDLLVLITDGVMEARREGALFDMTGVAGVLQANVGSAGAAVDALEQAVLAHTGGVLTDDMAAIALHALPRH